MTKPKTYIGVNCTQLNRPNHPSNSSISLYSSIVCISRFFIPGNDIQTSNFSPHDAWLCWIHPGVWCASVSSS